MNNLQKIRSVGQEFIDTTTDSLMPDYLRFVLFCNEGLRGSREEAKQAIDAILSSQSQAQLRGYVALRTDLRRTVRLLFIGLPLAAVTGFCSGIASGVGSIAWAVGDSVEFLDCVDQHAIHSIETDQPMEQYLKSTMTTCLDRDGVFSSEWTGQVAE